MDCLGALSAQSTDGIMAKKIGGIVSPTITPIKEGKIDEKAISKLMPFLEKSGASGILPAGSTGAFPFLDKSTHMSVLKSFKEHLGKSMLFLPGTGRNSVGETVELSKAALKLDADAVAVVTPYFIRLSQREIFTYFDKVAGAIGGPMMVYNIPQFTGNSITKETLELLVKRHKNIVGIKDSERDFSNFTKIVRSLSGKISVFQGQDDFLLPSLELGAAGGVCGTTNFADLAQKVYRAHASGRRQQARRLQGLLTKVMIASNSIRFPSNYNYLFYRKVVGSGATNATPPLEDISASDGGVVHAKISRLVGRA